MIKGFALDDERLKQGGTVFGKRYFDELLERIREIRASERMFYQKLTDIFAQSYDYDKTAQITFDFYSSIQNKLEYAVIGQTAAEIIIDRADSRKEHMGLKTWRDVGKGGKIQLDPRRIERVEPVGKHLPRQCRIKRKTRPPDLDAGLGRTGQCNTFVTWLYAFDGQRDTFECRRKGPRKGRIRKIPPDTGRAFCVGF